MIEANRMGVVLNPYQGEYKRVLCVCSGGVLRSPTTAWLLSQEPYNFNTRSAGTEDYALIAVDEALLLWAQEIVVMETRHAVKVNALLLKYGMQTPVKVLHIPDNFQYRNPKLIKRIQEAYGTV